jgi:hypothetical protein
VPHGAVDAAVHGLGLLVHSRLEADIALYGEKVELLVLPAGNALRVQPTDFDQSARLIREGYSAAQRLLARIAAEASLGQGPPIRPQRSRNDRLSRSTPKRPQAARGDRSGSISGHRKRLTRPTASAYTLAAHSSRSSAAA